MFSAKYVGHASVLLNFGSTKILTDPWFGQPFYANNMIAYPPISPLTPKEISEVTALHISHMHQDHFCEKTLAHFDKGIDILLGKYPAQNFKNKLNKIGFHNIIEIGEEAVTYKDLQVGIFLPEVFDYSFDSLSVWKFEGKSYFLNNDCLVATEKLHRIKKLFGDFHVGFVGYTMVNPYPSCFRIEGRTLEGDFAGTRKRAFDHVELIDSILQFERIVPYANGLRFFENDTLAHNQTFSNPVDFALSFSKPQKVQILEPGRILDLEKPTTLPRFQYDLKSMNQYLKSQNTKLEHDFVSQDLFDKSKYEQFFDQYIFKASEKWTHDMNIQINITDHKAQMQLFYSFIDNKLARANRLDKVELMISFPANWLNEAVVGKISMLALYFNFNFFVQISDPKLKNQYYVHGW